jgi:hypothetical protein
VSDKDFKVKNKLQVKGITTAGPITSDATGNIDSVPYIATQYGGTGTTTSPSSGQVLYSSGGSTYAPTTLNTLVTQQTPTDGASGNKTYVGTTTPSSPVSGDVWIDDTAGSLPSIFRWSKTAAGGETSVSGIDNSGLTLTYTAGAEQVYLNGTLLARGSDYVATNGSTITGLSPALVLNDIVNVISPLSAAISGTVSLTGDSTITGGLTSNTDSYFNGVRVGKGAGSQSSNMAIGNLALNSTTTGVGNVAIGNSALRLTTTGQANVAVGGGALELSVGGLVNTAVGAAALYKNTSGYNVAVGGYSMYNNTAGYFNVAVGASALNGNTTGYQNTALGYVALANNTTGINNTSIGSNSLYANTVGANLVAVGYNALGSNTIASNSTAVGYNALGVNTTGSSNTAVGFNALAANTTGYNNVAVGFGSLGANTFGYLNTAVGLYSQLNITTGAANTSIGYQAGGVTTTGNYNTSLGHDAKPSTATVSGEFTLGDANVSNLRCNDTTISALSDGRDKTDIIDNPFGLQFLNNLKPRQFKWETRDGNVKDGTTRLGFIAQELLEAADGNNDVLDLVYESNPERLEAKYGNLIPVLVKAVQELSIRLDSANAEIEILKGQIDA